MRKIIITHFSICILTIFNSNSFSQTNFGTVTTVASSDLYEIKNPLYDVKDRALRTSIWLSYERYKLNGASDIILRPVTFTGYGPEVVLTSAVNDSNYDQCLYDKLIVWVSNKDGNKNIYYSVLTGTTWSAPLVLPGSTSADETQPFITNNENAPNNFYILTFKRGNDIFLKRYITASGTWDAAEYNASDSVSEECSYSIISGLFDNFTCSFIRYQQPGVGFFRVVMRRFNLPSSGIITLQGQTELNYYASLEKMKLSDGLTFPYPMLTFAAIYSFVPIEKKEVYVAYDYNQNPPLMSLISNVPNGTSHQGKGTHKGVIANNLNSSSAGLQCSAFGSITGSPVTGDSVTVSLCKQFNSTGSSNDFTHIIVGGPGTQTNLDLSPIVYSGNIYKIRAIWEKNISGKTALVETFMTDVLGGINYLGTAVKYSLQQNYPNPFNPTTKIKYEIPVSAFVELKVFNVLGKEVSTLVNQSQTSGTYSVELNGSDLPSGIYFYSLRAGEFTQTMKMLLVK